MPKEENIEIPIPEQYDMLEQLRQRGYMAEFACGFDEAKEIIDEYLA